MIGTAGCSMDCKYCSNAYIAKCPVEEVALMHLMPEQVVRMAIRSGCHSIVFGINEPTVSLPSFVELARVAKREGILMGCLTNGYLTESSMQKLCDACDFINISLKGLNDQEYADLTGVSSIIPIFNAIRYASSVCHLEITTSVFEPVSEENLGKICHFIAQINPHIPWHVLRLLPEYMLKDAPAPDVEKTDLILRNLRSILPYTYFGNYVGAQGLSTLCPSCGNIVMERINTGTCGGRLIGYYLRNGNCPSCNTGIPLTGEFVDWEQARPIR
jgi:pyruvate-formate lyase-activating enzyme